MGGSWAPSGWCPACQSRRCCVDQRGGGTFGGPDSSAGIQLDPAGNLEQFRLDIQVDGLFEQGLLGFGIAVAHRLGEAQSQGLNQGLASWGVAAHGVSLSAVAAGNSRQVGGPAWVGKRGRPLGSARAQPRFSAERTLGSPEAHERPVVVFVIEGVELPVHVVTAAGFGWFGGTAERFRGQARTGQHLAGATAGTIGAQVAHRGLGAAALAGLGPGARRYGSEAEAHHERPQGEADCGITGTHDSSLRTPVCTAWACGLSGPVDSPALCGGRRLERVPRFRD